MFHAASLGVDLVVRDVLLHLVAHVVEDVELGLRGEERGVGDAGGGEVLLRLLGDLARVARVDLTIARVVDVEDHHQRALGAERVDVRGGHIGDQLQVGLVDGLEAADRGTVEQLADGEEVLVDGGGRNVEVLLDPGKVREPDVEELDIRVLDELEHLGGIAEHGSPEL